VAIVVGFHGTVSVCGAEDKGEGLDYFVRSVCINKQNTSLQYAFRPSPFFVWRVIFRVRVCPYISTPGPVTFNSESFQARKLVFETRKDVGIRNVQMFQMGTIDCIDYFVDVGIAATERQQVHDSESH